MAQMKAIRNSNRENYYKNHIFGSRARTLRVKLKTELNSHKCGKIEFVCVTYYMHLLSVPITKINCC